MMRLNVLHIAIAIFAFTLCLKLAESRWKTRPNFRNYDRVRLRRIRSDEGDDVSSDALTSSNVDTTLLNDLASVEIDENGEGLSERKRREKPDPDIHAERAESDVIASAAESAAAEADAIAAAIEVAKMEDEGDQGADSDDTSTTFEENDDGDDVVVVKDDPREKEHLGDKSHNSKNSAKASEFDMNEMADVHPPPHGTEHGSQHAGERVPAWKSHERPSSTYNSDTYSNLGDASSVSVQMEKGYSDVQTPLNALLTESSDLAKEVRLIFQVLARREDYLVQEMEKLKVALQNAIHVLQENNKVANLIRKKRDGETDDSNQYKACVYIIPPPQNAAPASLVQGPPSSEYEKEEEEEQPSTAALTGGNDEIDLKSVYWLKLPENEDEGILQKVHGVLTGMRDNGKDVIMIPVSKGYMSKEDVANGFLRAVRVNPTYYASSADSKKRRRRRKKLRLRIRRI